MPWYRVDTINIENNKKYWCSYMFTNSETQAWGYATLIKAVGEKARVVEVEEKEEYEEFKEEILDEEKT